jgi:hypothetical protein
VNDGRKRRTRSPRGGAALLVVALVSAGGVVSITGDSFAYSCEGLMATVTTNKPSYAPGQTVIISVTQANDGPTCSTITPPCGPTLPWASAYNSAGKVVWVYGVGKTIVGPSDCFIAPVTTTWRGQSSYTQEFDWRQDKCTPQVPGLVGHTNPGCPGTQVPAGRYRIVGGNGPSASTSITIAG